MLQAQLREVLQPSHVPVQCLQHNTHTRRGVCGAGKCCIIDIIVGHGRRFCHCYLALIFIVDFAASVFVMVVDVLCIGPRRCTLSLTTRLPRSGL